MQSVHKQSNVLDDNKKAVVTTPLSEKKLLTTEKFTTSDEVHKRTEKFTTSDEVVKGTDEVHKRTDNIKTNEDVDKGTEKLEDMKEAVVTICRKDSDKFEGQYKGSKIWFNLDRQFFRGKISTIEPDFYRKLYEKDIEGKYMELYKKFFVLFYSTKLNLNNNNDPFKNRASSSDKEKKPKEKVVAPICGEITLTRESIKKKR